MEDVKAVLDTLIPKESEVQTKAGAWYQMRMKPYRTLENVIEGVGITFIDITAIRRAREAVLRESDDLRRPVMVVCDRTMPSWCRIWKTAILIWNPGAERMYGWSEVEPLAMNIRESGPRETARGSAGHSAAGQPCWGAGTLSHATDHQTQPDRGSMADRHRVGE